MPETAVHEKCEANLSKDKIWFAEQRLIASPTCDAMSPKQLHQRQFRVLVPAPANPRHSFRSLFFGEEIGHARQPSYERIKNSLVSSQGYPRA